MKTILIIQNELPQYRDFLWEGLGKRFELYLADISKNQITLPDGTMESFREYIFVQRPDYLVLNAGIREIFNSVRYILKYRAVKILGWTQFVGKNKSLLSRVMKSIYLMLLFDKILLYYDHEQRLIPFKSLRNKSAGLNNTIADWPISLQADMDRPSILFIGRYTEKSRLGLFLTAALSLENVEVHIVGALIDEVPKRFHRNNIHYYGKIDDLIYIQDLSATCAYFVYPGDVGLSIVHAVKLGLIPLVHSDLDAHMPECRAVADEFPVIYFQKDDLGSLTKSLEFLIETKPSSETKQIIATKGHKIFSQEVMIKNFVNIVNGI